VPEARHRDAWAETAKAPSRAEHMVSVNAAAAPSAPARAKIVQTEATRVATAARTEQEDDVLVVVSKLKRYIRERSEMNTSDTVVAPLSDHLRALCNEAIRNAARDGRKTVMDRDFMPLLGKH
jgi:histone H3/H4